MITIHKSHYTIPNTYICKFKIYIYIQPHAIYDLKTLVICRKDAKCKVHKNLYVNIIIPNIHEGNQ